ncbi:primosomal replication protein [Acerihabitans sp. KWT182]|uniref:Primosomal replication protein n=1 Tax=Acerihabitans sp. KWT182 TaxID=3157919 RepID=A0AAU7QCS5_9GAMM
MQSLKFIDALSAQLDALAARIEEAGDKSAAQSRFDHSLFQSRGTGLPDYLAESKMTLRRLTQTAGQGRTEQVSWLAQRLVDQLTALARELATLDLRRRQAPRAAAGDDYARLAEHQDYERRLLALIRDRESLRENSGDKLRRDRLQQEIAALEGRLARCRHALTRIEKRIEYHESGTSGVGDV